MTPSIDARRLYIDAFPQNERRDIDAWIALAEAGGPFRIDEWQFQGHFAGFLTYWSFPRFTYVEHFATASPLRGKGMGGRWLDAFVAQTSNPVVLEVEPGDTTMAQRRIAFYERHGFYLSELSYVQPPYRKGDAPLPLRLMTTDSAFLAAHAAEVVRQIHHEVYGYDDNTPDNLSPITR